MTVHLCAVLLAAVLGLCALQVGGLPSILGAPSFISTAEAVVGGTNAKQCCRCGKKECSTLRGGSNLPSIAAPITFATGAWRTWSAVLSEQEQ
jgi:hypothetical protein